MIDKFYKNRFLIPCVDGAVTKSFIAGKHLGEDIGWITAQNTDILAAQEGTVVDKFYSATCGYSIVLQHDYSDGSHCWTGYIHLKQAAKPNKGDKVAQGQVIGIKGNTGTSTGTHLHLYMSTCTTKAYTWETMKSCCTIDPNPYLYRSKAITYNKLGVSGGYSTKLFLEDLPQPITYPTPVERDENVKQVNVLISILFMRDAPNGNAYEEYCPKGIFNIYKEQIAGNYCWYLIDTIDGNQFWIASGGARTEDLLPVLSNEEILQNKLDEVQAEYDALDEAYHSLEVEAEALAGEKAELETKLLEASSENEGLAAQLLARKTEIETLQGKITRAIKELG